MNTPIEPNPAPEKALVPTVDRNAQLKSYWLLDDVVCREFLQLGTETANFASVRLVFPVVRELTVGRAPRIWSNLSDTLELAYYAGHDLGCHHPKLQEELLAGDEANNALQRLKFLHQAAGEKPLTPGALDQAFHFVADSAKQKSDSPEINREVAVLILKSVRAGFASATIARTDPTLAEILFNAGEPVAGKLSGTFERAVVNSLRRTYEDGLVNRPWHPLLRYPNRYTPIPPNGKRCEFTGMKHAKLYDMLSVGGIARNKVRVANLRSPGTNRGQTLFHVGDMLRFLDELAAEQMRLDAH